MGVGRPGSHCAGSCAGAAKKESAEGTAPCSATAGTGQGPGPRSAAAGTAGLGDTLGPVPGGHHREREGLHSPISVGQGCVLCAVWQRGRSTWLFWRRHRGKKKQPKTNTRINRLTCFLPVNKREVWLKESHSWVCQKRCLTTGFCGKQWWERMCCTKTPQKTYYRTDSHCRGCCKKGNNGGQLPPCTLRSITMGRQRGRVTGVR